jgi:hypothetical protein
MTAVAMVFPEPELRPSDPEFVIFSDGLLRVGAMVSGCLAYFKHFLWLPTRSRIEVFLRFCRRILAFQKAASRGSGSRPMGGSIGGR